MSIWQTIETLLRIESAELIFSTVHQRALQMGFDNVGFAACRHAPGSSYPRASCDRLGASAVVVMQSYASEWAGSYHRLQQSSAALTDARVRVSRLGLPAAAWNTRGEMSLPAMRRIIPQAVRQIDAAAAFGIKGGITLPVQARRLDWGFFTFSSDSTYELATLEACLSDAQLLTSVAAARIIALTEHGKTAHFDALNAPDSTCQRQNLRAQPSAERAHLTARESEVLRWCASGKTSWEIAEILSISERTVNFHLSKIAQRLGVRGRLAACAVAISSRLIAL